MSLTRIFLTVCLILCWLLPAWARANVGNGCDQAQIVGNGAKPDIGVTAGTVLPVESFTRIPRIALWGDSHTSAGAFVDTLMEAWGQSPAAGARIRPAFIPAAMGVAGVRLPLRRQCVMGGWKFHHAYRSHAGLGGGFTQSLMQLASDTPNDIVWLDFGSAAQGNAAKRVNVHFSKADPQSRLMLAVSINNGAEAMVSLSDRTLPYFQVRGDVPIETLRLRLVIGQITLHSFEPAYQQAPSVVLDVFSAPGATAHAWNRSAFPNSSPIPYDMVILQYGTNEAANQALDITTYTNHLRQSLKHLRAAHAHARCVLIGAPDRGNGNYSALHQRVNAVQERVSQEFQCEFWNWQAAMPEGMRSWANSNLAQPDLIHLTPKGYAVSARTFARAIAPPWNKK